MKINDTTLFKKLSAIIIFGSSFQIAAHHFKVALPSILTKYSYSSFISFCVVQVFFRNCVVFSPLNCTVFRRLAWNFALEIPKSYMKVKKLILRNFENPLPWKLCSSIDGRPLHMQRSPCHPLVQRG
jgi:hypothetical protein